MLSRERMPVSINSCPGCQAAVLPDTVSCPACGHVLKNDTSTSRSEIDADVVGGLVTAEMEYPCRKCGQLVRSGLLRCWNCNEFMRKDIAERFRQLQSAPQKIVYSETDREEYLPPRIGAEPSRQQTFTASDADFDVDGGLPAIDQLSKRGEFTLGDSGLADAVPAASSAPAPVADSTAGSFDMDAAVEAPAPTPAEPPVASVTPDASPPANTTAPAEPAVPADESSTNASTTEANPTEAAADPATPPPPAIPIPGEEDLFAVALAEQKEEAARRKVKRKARRAKRNGILVFCPRGHRIEVAMKFAGKRGKCPKCKAPFAVPRPSDDSKKSEDEAPAEKKVTVPWLWDVKIHEVDPATLKLKPGSLVKSFSETDLFFDTDKLHITRLVATKKGRNATAKQKDKAREGVKEHLENSLALKDLPVGENEVLKNEDMSVVVVVQPTLMPHESIFAGLSLIHI